LQVQQTGPSDFVAEFLGSIDSEPCLVAYVQAASACYETVVTRLGCTAFVVDQRPVVFVELAPVNLVAEEVCSVLASQQLMALAAVEHAIAAVEMLVSASASAVVVLDAAGVKGYSSYWCQT
jgi:hypothetical protein